MIDVSDQTMLGEKSWKDLKAEVCQSEDYKNAEWFQSLPQDKKLLTTTLKEMQNEVGISEALPPQSNPHLQTFISERIEQLFPESNFYFYKIFQGDEERMQKEKDQLRLLIEDNILEPRLYIESGLLEPVHLQEEERKLLIEGMQASITKIVQELIKSQEL